MKEELEQSLVALATEIIAKQGKLNLTELNKQAHRLAEKTTILSFVDQYYQSLGAKENRRDSMMKKVSHFIDENQEKDIFNIKVEATEVQPITLKGQTKEKASFVAMEPKPVQKQTTKIAQPQVEIHQPEPEWVQPQRVNNSQIDFAIEQPQQVTQPEQFIEQPEYTDEQRILKQSPSLEEFISQSKHTVFDKKETDEDIKPVQSLNDKLGKNAQIGLNDKLAFVQKLFFGSESEYNKVVKHISEVNTMQDAVLYLEQEIKPTYNYWKGKEEYEERFLNLLLKRFEV
ncbi:hypothetical protein RCZ04_02800 [Capnocytophaga sp. HP1101]